MHQAWPSRGSIHAIYCVYEQVAYADCECPLLGSFGLRNFEMLPSGFQEHQMLGGEVQVLR